MAEFLHFFKGKLTNCSLTLIALFFLGFLLSFSGWAQASISSDEPDYQPGSIATFTGAGFQPGESVQINVLHSLHPEDNAGIEHQPWNIIADSTGNFTETWQLSQTHCIGVLLRATAIGQSSGENVWTEFTDPTITSTASGGNWSSASTWFGGVIPGVNDDVYVAIGAIVNVTDARSAKSITLNGGNGNTNLNISSGIALTISGDVTINAPGSNNRTNTIAVGAGTLNVGGNLTVTGGGPINRQSILTISTGSVDVNGTITNANSTSSIVFSGAGTLNIAGNWTNNGTFTPSTSAVTFDGTTQSIGGTSSTTFNNLILSGGTKTFGAARTISSNLSINSGAIANLGTFSHTVNTLTLGGINAASGTWGSTSSPATHTNNTYFGATTGIVTVAIDPCTAPIAYNVTGTGSYCAGGTGVAVGLDNSQTGVNYQFYRGATLVGSAVSGTGTAFSFGLQTTAGTYTVLATRVIGGCTNNMNGSAIVTINQIPSASLTPNNIGICQGESATLSIALTGTGTISGDLSDGTTFSGAAGTTLTVNVSPIISTIYTIASLTNGTCTGTGTGQTTVTIKGKYTANAGDDQTICPTATASVSGTVGGSPTTTLWTTSGTGIFDDASLLATDYTPSAADVTAGSVTLTLTASGTGTCDGADNMELTFYSLAAITTQPSAVTTTYGDGNVNFSVTASGTGPLTYQWQVNTGSGFNNITLTGIYSDTDSNPATLEIDKPNYSMNGYSYQVIVSGACPSPATSSAEILTVIKKSIEITANAQTKTYGDADPSLTYGFSPALVSGDSFSGSLSRTGDENVGNYAVEQGSLALSSNYILNYTGAAFDITQLTIAVTADAQTKTYGDGDPSLTYGFSPALVSGDSFSGSLSRTGDENVGNYVIEQGSLALSTNYVLSFTGAAFDITARPITITAEAKQKYSGQVDPPLTYQITNGNLIVGASFTGFLSRVLGENSGSYAINRNTVSLGTNFNLSYVSAFLTINCITAIDASASSTPVQIGSYASLSAAVTPNVSGVSVTFNIYNEAGVVVATVSGTTISGIATATAPILPLGVYKVVASVGECASSMAYIPVFDPNGDFVTGGGWINSPSGALTGSTIVGKANFGFVSKYKKGKNEVDGNTEFQFNAGNINFKSTYHETGSLVISGAKATYRGNGTINGISGFKFTLVAIDGDYNGVNGPDKFRIKISGVSGGVIYDNGLGADENSNDATILGGGSIVIHNAKGNGKGQEGTLVKTTAIIMQEMDPEILESLVASPNPVVSFSKVRFSVREDANVILRVYDYSGRMIETLYNGQVKAYQNHDVDFQRKNLMSGIYIVKLTTDKGQSYDKRIIVE